MPTDMKCLIMTKENSYRNCIFQIKINLQVQEDANIDIVYINTK